VSPDNVHETGVSPAGQSGPPIAAAESRADRVNWKKEMVTDPIPRFVPYTVSGMLEPLGTCAVRKGPIREWQVAGVIRVSVPFRHKCHQVSPAVG
jgi:hypothetical protein